MNNIISRNSSKEQYFFFMGLSFYYSYGYLSWKYRCFTNLMSRYIYNTAIPEDSLGVFFFTPK